MAESSTVQRRTIAKGAAWAVPVIAVGAPIPASAASPGCNPVFTFGGDSCKCPGQSSDQSWGYYLSICVTDGNNCIPDEGGAPQVIYIHAVQNNSGKALVPSGSDPLMIPLGSCSETILFNSSSSSHSIQFFYSIGGDDPVWSDFIPAPPDCASEGSGNEKVCLPPGSFGG